MFVAVQNILAAILFAIVVYLLMSSRFRNFLFKSTYGRAIMLLSIVVITTLNMPLGLILTAFIIGLHTNSNASEFIEGLTNQSSSESETEIDSSSSLISHPSEIRESLTNRTATKNNYINQLSTEESIRPKSSKVLDFPYLKKKSDPDANSPGNEGFATYSAF